MEIKKLTVEALFSDSGPIDEDAVVRALKPHVMVQKPDYAIFFKETKLSAERKILAYALAKKLLKIKALINIETISAQEVFEKTGLKKGTIDPTFQLLRKKGLLAGKRDYAIPSYKVPDIIKLINKEN